MNRAGVWGMARLYSAGILFVGVGLHPFLKRWTTLAMTVLFVMLDFTGSGGLFRPELQNGFFGALHAFWNGAGFVEGACSLLYFGGDGLGRAVWTMVVWLPLGLAVTAAAAAHERTRTPAGQGAHAGVARTRRVPRTRRMAPVPPPRSPCAEPRTAAAPRKPRR
ncbi:hypothetical protein [Streptomyces sp. NPDC003697]